MENSMDCQLIVSIEAKKYFQNILKTNNQAINLELKNALHIRNPCFLFC